MTRPWLFGLLVAATILMALVPVFGSAVLIQYGINALIFATLAQSWNIIGGFTGYASFGNSVFFGLGAYGTAIAMTQFGLPFWAGLPLGAVLGVLCALLVGLPVLRLRGHYFAIATLGLSLAAAAIVSNLEIAGANIGLILPLTRADGMFFELALALLVACVLCVWWISRSRFGMGLIAIREDEDAAASLGKNVLAYKLQVLAIGSALAGVAGCFYAWQFSYFSPDDFQPLLTFFAWMIVILGGLGRVWAVPVGAAVFGFLFAGTRFLDFPPLSYLGGADRAYVRLIVIGLAIIGLVLWRPQGILGKREEMVLE
jgi:branched-chain amino acid transport system permease protein